MKVNRRELVKCAGVGVAAAGLASLPAVASERVPTGKTKMHLGTVTYNMAKDWDLETILTNLPKVNYEGVELRTTHAHDVEVDLTPKQREDVKKRFEDSDVTLVGLGSAFDYHTPDQDKLRRDIEATKKYMILARDVGTDGVKVRPNAIPKEVPKEKTIEQIGKSLREIGEFGETIGVEIRVEVHGGESSLLPNIKAMMDVADHKNVGVCWNCNRNDLEGEGFDYNFNLVKDKLFLVHLKELCDEWYPYRKLFVRLNEMGYNGFCLAEVSGMKDMSDSLRFMKYYRGLWLAYQNII